LLEQETKSKIDLSNIISNDRKIISLFSGSRSSEVNLLLPILIDFINLMNKKFDNFTFVFHATDENKDLISEKINNLNLKNVEVISDENIKKQIITKSIFAVSKSGTISLEICNAKVPFITIYKMNLLNFLIVKMLVKIKFANIINIINNKEIIPELIQKECNAKEIYNSVVYFLKNPELMKKQINDCEETLTKIRSKTSSSDEASFVLSKFLIG
jgi:lipid-A-disaccharide synthase